MEFRDLFNHVVDKTIYEDVEKKADIEVVKETKRTLKKGNKLRRVKESNLRKEERDERSKKVHEAIRRRRKSKQELQERDLVNEGLEKRVDIVLRDAGISEDAWEWNNGLRVRPENANRIVKALNASHQFSWAWHDDNGDIVRFGGDAGDYSHEGHGTGTRPGGGFESKVNEALKPEAIVKIQGMIDTIGTWETARKLLDSAVNRVIGLGMDDLGDTTIVANGLDSIEDSLSAGNIQNAWDDAKAIAHEMLEDEGMTFEGKKPIKEDSLLTGGATVPNDPDFANPQQDAEPGIKKELRAEETDRPEEPKEDKRDIPLEGDKEYLGNKGGEDYFYFVIIPAEDGTKDLQIQDANDDVVFSAKENEIDIENTEDFLWKGIKELELSNISLEVVEKYLLPDEKEEDVEMEDTEEESVTDVDDQASRITPDAATDSTKQIRTPGGFVAKQGMGESVEEKTQKSVEIDVKEVQTMVKEAKIKKLLEKYNLNEAFDTKEQFIDFVKNNIIPELEHARMEDAIKAFYEAIEWMGGEPTTETPEPEEKKYYNIDMDKLYKTGDVGEAKMKELLEKFGMLPSKIDSLMEKFGLVEAESSVRRSPKGIEDLDKMATPDPSGGPSPDILVAPGEDGVASPEEPHVSADAEPAPEGGEPKAEDMGSPESAKANITMQYPEEPFTSTALAFADSLVDEPKVYGALRNLKWQGAYANSETFLKQAKIVGDYNEFNPDIAKRLVDAVGDGAKFRLAREGSVAVYFTIRDTDKKISLTTLKDIVRAQEMEATGNPGEARVWWD